MYNDYFSLLFSETFSTGISYLFIFSYFCFRWEGRAFGYYLLYQSSYI